MMKKVIDLLIRAGYTPIKDRSNMAFYKEKEEGTVLASCFVVNGEGPITYYIERVNQWKQQLISQGQSLIDEICIAVALEGAEELVGKMAQSFPKVWVLDSTQGELKVYGGEELEGEQILLARELSHILEQQLVKQKKEKKSTIKWWSLASVWLILINIIVFVILRYFGGDYDALCDRFGCGSLQAILDSHEYYRVFTAIFLHGDWDHLLSNMFMLWAIGKNLEEAVGKRWFLILYVFTGIIASISSALGKDLMGETIVSIGASGAIFGIAGAFLGLLIFYKYKNSEITKFQLVVCILGGLHAGFTASGVDNIAHVAGVISGLGVMLFGRANFKKETLAP